MLIKVKEKSRTIKRLKLKELREEHGIAQGDIASKAGVSQAFLSAVESGRRPASDKLKQVLIDQFHVNNLEDYEIEVETDDAKGYSFLNNGQYNEGQSGGTANFYDMKNQPQEPPTSPPNPPDQPSASTLEVMTEVVKDYLNKNSILQREKEELKEELKEAKLKILELEKRVTSLSNKVVKLSKK